MILLTEIIGSLVLRFCRRLKLVFKLPFLVVYLSFFVGFWSTFYCGFAAFSPSIVHELIELKRGCSILVSWPVNASVFFFPIMAGSLWLNVVRLFAGKKTRIGF